MDLKNSFISNTNCFAQKAKDLRIAVCIPSKNEEDSIEQVLKNIDSGLNLIGNPKQHLIVNIDSNSSDNTIEKFKNTPTTCRKISLKTTHGKGGNLIKFLDSFVQDDFNLFATFDADLISLKPSWIIQMTEKILNHNAEYVIPIYSRSLYEGSTTNHFCFPLIYGLFGKIIRQPIAGDFMFSHDFCKKLHYSLKETPISIGNNILDYGIDIFFTLTAIKYKIPISQVVLDKKIHKPSHLKMEKMFSQIVVTMFEIIKTLKTDFVSSINSSEINFYNQYSQEFEIFSHKSFGIKKRKEIFIFLNKNEKFYKSFLRKNFKYLKNCHYNGFLSNHCWVIILLNFLEKYLKNELSNILLVKYLTPLFIWRSISHWIQAEKLTSFEAENEIINQAIFLRKSIKNIMINQF